MATTLYTLCFPFMYADAQFHMSVDKGVPSCANEWLLTEVLRKQWGREDAVVTTDSGAILNLQGP